MEKKPTSGMGVTGLVLGIIALISSVVPLLNLLSFPFVLLAIIFGAIGVFQTVKGTKGGKGIAISGLVLGILALIVTVAMYGGAAASASSSTSTATSSSAGTEQTASSQQGAADQGATGGEAAAGDQATSSEAAEGAAAETAQQEATAPYAVTIDGAEMGEDYQGNKAAIITYTFTNNSDDAKNFMTTIGTKVFQDGVELESAIMVDGVDSQDLMKDIKPGKSITVKQAYVLADTKNDVAVEVTELWDFSNELIAEKTFSMK